MIVAACNNNFLPRERQNGFIATFSLVILVAVAEWLGVYLDGAAFEWRAAHIAAKFFEFSLTPVISVVCAWAIGARKYIRWMALPLAANAAAQLFSAHFGFIFFVDADNLYHRRAWYWLYIAAFLMGTAYLFLHSYQLSRQYQNRNGLLLALILTFLMTGTGVQIIEPDLRIDWLCVAISGMLFFIYYSDLVQQMDALTHLLNRRSFDCSMQKVCRPAVVLFLDVDGFKAVNDHFGHAFGDECLSCISRELLAVYGRDGLCYRFGGDEFCVLLFHRMDDAVRLNSDFVRRIEHRRALEPRLPLVSVGYARFDPAKERMEDAMGRADAMMYQYKHLRAGTSAGSV